ncbi:MAG: hypothetical protein ACFB6R_18335 [Alphaproteobacteria bacterium]
MGKILVFLAIAIAGYLFARRVLTPQPPETNRTRDQRPGGGRSSRVEEMRECPTCGTFRPASLRTPCERADCPLLTRRP